MEIAEFEITRYKNNIQSGFGFSVAFPDILRIQHEPPVHFQERVRQEGYPEFQMEMAEDTGNRVFEFFSNEHDYRIGFGKDLLVLIYNGTSIHYEDIRTRIEYMVNTFSDLYSPAYFKRVNLRHQYSIEDSFLSRLNIDLNLCVPTYIFPEVSTIFSENLYSLSKNSQFNYNGTEIIAEHVFRSTYIPSEMNNEELYGVSVGCFYEQNIGDINGILTKFDQLKQSAWNILQSSITDYLREAMVEVK